MKKLCSLVLFLLGMVVSTGPGWCDAVFTFVPRLTLSEEYTDNVDLVPKEKREEWTTVLSPGFDANLLWKTRSLRLSYAPGFAYAAKDDANSEIRQDLSLAYQDQLSRNFRVSVRETLQRTELPYTVQDPVFQRQQEDETGRRRDRTIRRNREPYTESTSRAAVDYTFGARDRLTAAYVFSVLDNDDPTVEDNHRHNPRVSVIVWPWDHYGIDAGFLYERGEYSGKTEYTDDVEAYVRFLREFSQHLNGFVGYRHAVSQSIGKERDYSVYEPFIGVDWESSKDFFASVSLGYFLKEDDVGSNDSGPTLSGDVGKSWRFRRGAVRLTGGTGYEQSYGGAENLGFTLFYRAGLAANYALGKHLDSIASVSVERNEYLDEEPERDDNTYTFSGTLRYQMRRWLFWNLAYIYQKVDSSLNEKDYNENRVMMSVSLIPPQGLRYK